METDVVITGCLTITALKTRFTPDDGSSSSDLSQVEAKDPRFQAEPWLCLVISFIHYFCAIKLKSHFPPHLAL